MADLALTYKTWKTWIGQRVYVKKSNFGTLKYFGEIKFKDGFWCGVELDEPVGDNDGMINNLQYFKCKAKHGIFVPVCETKRLKSASEINPVRDLIKLKYAGCSEDSTSTNGLNSTFSQNLYSSKQEIGDEIDHKIQSRNSNNLNKTFYKNEVKIIPDSFCFKAPKEKLYADYVVNTKHINVSKRSKNTNGRLETDESLGIISDLLDEEESWNLLDESTTKGIGNKCFSQKSSDKIDNDSVFYPLTETSLLDSKTNFDAEKVDSSVQKCLNSKCTSTPKRCISNLIDLNRTVKLNDKQSDDFLHDEPIVAGSSKLTFETDFDLGKFKQSDILCSTLKFSVPALPILYSAPDEISCINNELVKSNNTKYQEMTKLSEREGSSKISTISNVCVNTKQFANIHKGCIAENSSDALNTTFIINSDLLSSPDKSKDYSPHAVPGNDSFYSDRKSNGQLDSTFATNNNLTTEVLEGEKTFIIDCSPIKIPPEALSLKCEAIPKKKTLSIIFEKASSENVAINGTAESEDEQTNTISNESRISSKLLFEDMNQVMKKSSRSKITSSNLNSTFCINSDEKMNKKNIAYLDVKTRYSLSSISVKDNVCIKKEKSVTTLLKANEQKSIAQSRLSVITKKKSFSSTNSTSSLKQFKDVKSRIKNSTEFFAAKKFLETTPKRKLKKTCSTLVESSSDAAYAREQLKKPLVPCKSVDNFGLKQENASHSSLKTTENNFKVVERCKGVTNLPTKVIPKMSSNYKDIAYEYLNSNRKVKELTSSHEFNSKNPIDVKLGVFKHRHSMLPTAFANSENSNFNLKVNTLTGSHEISSKNPMDLKLGNVKHRHSMLPTVQAKPTHTKNSTSKDRNDVKCIINAVKSSCAFTDIKKSVPPSKIHQDDIGNKRSTGREHMEEFFPAEKVSENNIKYAKKSENLTIFKSKLLKPRALSRLPVPEKLSKKPGCGLDTVDLQSEHNIKSINKTDNQRVYKRVPLQKLQDKH